MIRFLACSYLIILYFSLCSQQRVDLIELYQDSFYSLGEEFYLDSIIKLSKDFDIESFLEAKYEKAEISFLNRKYSQFKEELFELEKYVRLNQDSIPNDFAKEFSAFLKFKKADCESFYFGDYIASTGTLIELDDYLNSEISFFENSNWYDFKIPVLINLSNRLRLLGLFENAKHYVIQAIALCDKYSSSYGGAALVHYAGILRDQGLIEDAIAQYEKAIDLLKTETGNSEKYIENKLVTTILLLSDQYRKIGNLKRSGFCISEAKTVMSAESKYKERFFFNSGKHLFDSESYDEATDFFLKCKNAREEIFVRTLELAEINFWLGKTYNQTKQYSKALEVLKEALYSYKVDVDSLKHLEENTPAHLDNIIEVLYEMQIALHGMNDNESLEQLDNLTTLLPKLLDKSHASFYYKQDKLALLRKSNDILRGQFVFLEDVEGSESQMFDLMEKYSSYNLSEAFTQAKAYDKLAEENESFSLLNQLNNQETYLIERVKKEEAQEETNIELLANFSSTLFQVRSQKDSLNQLLKKETPNEYKILKQKSLLGLKAFQNSLNENELALRYLIDTQLIMGVAITKDEVIYKRISNLDNNVQTKTTAVLDFLDLFAQKNSSVKNYKDAAHELYSKLLKPFIDEVEKSRLIIMPDGILNYLPFDILLTKQSESDNFKELPYLINDYSISYHFSGSLKVKMDEENKGKKKAMLAIAPSFELVDDYLQPMTYNEEEVRSLVKLFKGKELINKEATKADFLVEAPKYKIIHLATHGLADNSRLDNSYLSFTQKDSIDEEELLYLPELYTSNLNNDLAVLSACETSIGRYQKGEGVMSLSRAFAYAGCNSIVTSLWKVNQKTTYELMVSFYKGLKAGLPKDEALRKAKLEFIQSHDVEAHPYYWAAFTNIGSTKPLVISNNKSILIKGLLIVGGLVLLVFGLKRIKNKSAA